MTMPVSGGLASSGPSTGGSAAVHRSEREARAEQEAAEGMARAADSPVRSLRVALIHDWLTGMRGGERVLEAMCEIVPQAEIFTLVYVDGRISPTITRHPIHTSFVQRLPKSAQLYRYYLPLFPL